MAKALARIPKGTSIFVDANIFHLYLRGPKPIRDICTEFLERIEKGELKRLYIYAGFGRISIQTYVKAC